VLKLTPGVFVLFFLLRRDLRSAARAGLSFALLTFAIAPHWLLPSGGGRELHWSWWQQAMGDSYTLIGLAALTQAAIKNLLPRPQRRAPGAAGMLARRQDQGLRPVLSGTRDDASVPART
jgi:alpha-1,2-mannosyltransferase